MQRLLSIDCLRGLAALGVVLHHACLHHPAGFPPGHPVTILEEALGMGFTGVWLFFVISGFCIHLRQARAMADGTPAPIDFVGFWKRRVVRLYPTYTIALMLYLALSLLGGMKVDGSLSYDIFMHLAMLHNLDRATVYSFCGVFWTLALEEQLYMAYFLLLALRRRLGWRWTLLICLGARVATFVAHMLMKRRFGIDLPVKEMASSQWFVWALGALSVEAYYGLVTLPRWCREPRVGAGLLGLAALGITFVRHHSDSPFCKPIWFGLDPLLGLGFFVVVNRLVMLELAWRPPGKAPRLVRRLARVGLFSYSLYLTHELIITYLSEVLARWCGVEVTSLFLLALAPLCVVLAWVFFQLFERPFIAGPAPVPAPRIMPAPQGLRVTPI